MEKGSFKNMKKQNQKNILSLIKNEDGISRSQIADKLKISRATVTNIVRELISYELVQEAAVGKSRGGRRPMLLNLKSKGAFVIGIEWGIDSVKAVLLNLKAKIIADDQIEVQSHDFEEYKKISFNLIEKYQNQLEDSTKIIGIGLGIHGLVDPEKGLSIFTPHFNWDKINIKKVIAKKFNYPIFIDNDVRMMAAGEIWQGRDDFVFINTGSGIGSALVFKSKLHYGNNYAAGELGHMKVKDGGPKCHCGKNGCLESLASKESIILRYKKLNNIKDITFKEIINRYQAGEKEALLVVNDALKYFSRAISNILNILNPEAVIIGGLFAEYDQLLLKKLHKIITEDTLNQIADDLKITTAFYKDFAGAVGAAEKVLNNFFEMIN
ncbi:Glucokinase [Halanaerobium saccharolyticum subsp. saccharolyticum DSM 6643]|uniref:Glucokinase n=1 Tax=Halanaerobium saccharolyticum subsp. saccharolyticum DSM 6643 TaxID=1293054 RepID=M5DYV4_9FIRM|nr:ROK family transcriptional regulator [Halanaerobium saccharolyticum]CCU78238.1 Glucokinase [Halanaerobium saccharolyticum subsp. saccharolyticum DSM 6643]